MSMSMRPNPEAPINVKLLREIEEAIKEAEKTKTFNMYHFGYNNTELRNYEPYTANFYSYDTQHCIGGWGAYLMAEKDENGKVIKPVNNLIDVQIALNLSHYEWQRLCFADEWPIAFWDRKITWDEITAETAIARIEHFIATDGRE